MELPPKDAFVLHWVLFYLMMFVAVFLQSNYIQHKELKAAQGCKITGKDLEKVMAGAPIFAAENHDEIEVLKVLNN